MSEVRALLLTDVVDSTKLAAALGDAALAEVWAAHDRVARDLLPPWRGREIDKSDGMLLLFDDAADAVGYAIAYHRGLAALPVALYARTGLHVGPVLLRANETADVARGAKPLEVEGLAKSIAARVMSIAQGGQILLTSEAREALGGTSHKLQSHGHWMVKGVADPLELFEVGAPEARFAAPLDGEKVYRVVRVGDWWMPVKEIPNNLPQQGTTFFGRERELEEVKSELSGARLLTLLGTGGLGKTRLSLQVAVEVMHEYPDGVWFLDLAPIRDPALVVAEAARALGLREELDRHLLQTLCAHLKTRRVLMILDNCEHLVKPAAELAHALIKSAPFAHLLASSRQALRVPGERVFPILPLPLPKPGDDLKALLQSPAVRLFVDRAKAHKPAFELNEREAPAVASLVAHLEGIPLALELAAPRVRSLSVADINTRLKDRYKILTGGDRVLQERQQTLRALVDWSYELLSESERTVLNRLSVFSGGFDMPAAEAVCGADPLADCDVLDFIESLLEKSLVMLDDRDEGMRYRMLETIRDYSREKLEHSGEMAAALARHCDHYFAICEAAQEGLQGPQRADWVWRVEAELNNVRAAIALTLEGGVDPFIAVKFMTRLSRFWILRGYSTEGRSLVRAALALAAVQASDLAQAWALYVGAALAESQSDYAESVKMLETCLVLLRGLGRPLDIAGTLSTLTPSRLELGDADGAEAGQREAMAHMLQVGDRVGEAIGLLHFGLIAIYRGDDAQANTSLENCLVVARQIKYNDIEGECQLMLGETAFEAADIDRATQCYERSLTACREGGDTRGEANALWHLGRTELQGGDVVSARSRLDDALRAFQALGMRNELLGCLEDHAMLARAERRPDAGLRIAGAVEVAREKLGLKAWPRRAKRWQIKVAAMRSAMPGEDYRSAWDEGRQWQVEEAIRAALSAPVGG